MVKLKTLSISSKFPFQNTQNHGDEWVEHSLADLATDLGDQPLKVRPKDSKSEKLETQFREISHTQ